MRELRSWIFLGLGLLLAGLTGLALYGVSQEYGSRQAAGSDAVEIVTARADIAPRTLITVEMLGRSSLARNIVPSGAIANESAAVGQTTVATIPAGTAIIGSQFVGASGKKGASVGLEKGKVLIAFPTVDPLTSSGLVNAGDHVDILATIGGEGLKKTQTTLQNLEVVDVLLPGTDRSVKTPSLTFIVDHQTALVLKYLRDTATTIDIAVRSRTESEIAATTPVDVTYVLQNYGIRR